MQRGGILQSAQAPPLLTHRVANSHDVDSGTLLRATGDNGCWGITENIEFWDLCFDTMDYLPSGGDDIFG